jgi:hypothetical protein
MARFDLQPADGRLAFFIEVDNVAGIDFGFFLGQAIDKNRRTAERTLALINFRWIFYPYPLSLRSQLRQFSKFP